VTSRVSHAAKKFTLGIIRNRDLRTSSRCFSSDNILTCQVWPLRRTWARFHRRADSNDRFFPPWTNEKTRPDSNDAKFYHRVRPQGNNREGVRLEAEAKAGLDASNLLDVRKFYDPHFQAVLFRATATCAFEIYFFSNKKHEMNKKLRNLMICNGKREIIRKFPPHT